MRHAGAQEDQVRGLRRLVLVWAPSPTGFACVLSLSSCVRLFVTSGLGAHQVPLSVGFSRQEYWRGLSCSPPGDLPDPGTEPQSLVSPVLAGRSFTANVP